MNYFVEAMQREIGTYLIRVWLKLYRIPAPVSTNFDPENPLEYGILDKYQETLLHRAFTHLVDELTLGLTRLKARDVTYLAAVENQMIFLFHAYAFIIQHVSPCRFVQAAVFKYFCEQHNRDVARRFSLFVNDADPILGIGAARTRQSQVAGVLSTQRLEKQNPGVERFSTDNEPMIGTPITSRFMEEVSIFNVCSVDADHKTCPLCGSSPKDYFDSKCYKFSWAQLGHNGQPTQVELDDVIACLAAERYKQLAETEAIEVN